jgi:hypothetical protein
MSGSGRHGVLPPGRARRWWVLALALIITVCCGVAYLLGWRQGLRGHELLQFFTVYLALPMAVALLLLFAYLRHPKA